MAKKIPWLETVDWRNVTGIVAVLGIILAAFLFVLSPDLVRDNKLSRYQGQTTATVTHVQENTEMHQGHGGTSIYTGSYTLSYSYEVDGEIFFGVERIEARSGLSKRLDEIMSSASKQVMLKYDESNPKKSMIWLK